jgi:hypothetical protein
MLLEQPWNFVEFRAILRAVALLRTALPAAVVSFSLVLPHARANADTVTEPPQPTPAGATPNASGSFTLPADCGSEDEFRSELERLAGAHAPQAYPLQLEIIETSSSDSSERFRLLLEVRGERRELTHADCRALFRGAVVIAAASVKPPPLPPPAPAPPPAREPPPTPPGVPRDDGPDLRGSLSLGAGAALGVLPGLAAVVEFRGTLELDAWGFSLAGRFLPPTHAAQEGRGVDVVAAGARVAGTFRPVRPLNLSAGVDLDWLEGTGDAGISERQTDAAWGVAPSLEFALIPFESQHLRLEAATQARVALLRPRFVVTGFRDVYQVPSFGGAGLVRGVFVFP